MVQGLAYIVADRREVARLGGEGPVPAIPEPGEVFVRIKTEVLTGRRFASPQD
jgi:hypothetical protein